MKDKYAIILIILAAALLYTLTLKGVVGNTQVGDIKNNLDQATKPLELSPERGRFASVMALGDTGHYDLGQKLAVAVYPDVGFHEGKFYPYFAPGLAYLDLPAYVLGKYFGLSQIFSFGFVSLVGLLSLLVLYKIARNILNLPVWASLFVVLVFAFGTTSWGYAVTLYQHLFTVFFMLLSFYAVWKYRQLGTWSWLWACIVWINYGLAISIDYPNTVLLLPVMVYFLVASFRVSKDLASIKVSMRPAFVAAMVLFLGIFAWNAYINQENFGSWKHLSSQLPQYSGTGAGTVAAQANQPNSDVVVNEISAQKGLGDFFYENNVPFGFFTLTFSPDRGLFFYMPVLLLAFFGIYKLGRRMTLETGVLLALVLANVFLYSSWGDPWGGWAYGPRYLIPTMAVLSLFVGLWVAKASRPVAAKIATIIIFIYSSAIALLGVLTTNAVPPKIEADKFHLTYYNFLLNWKLFLQGKSSSVLYNAVFARHLSLWEYAAVIYILLFVLVILTLFLMPKFEHEP